jgi:hypothetical protein
MSLEKRQTVEREVRRLNLLTRIAVLTLAVFAGVSKRTRREWQERREQETRHNGHIPWDHWTTPDDQAAIIAYRKDRMELGYRLLCWKMADSNIAAVSPGTVYNVLKRGSLTKKRAEMREESKKDLNSQKRYLSNGIPVFHT